MKLFLIIMIVFLCASLNEVSASKTVEEKESEIVDFNAIKDVLKNDMLNGESRKKIKKVKSIKKIRRNKNINKYNIPDQNSFWKFMSEYWLVKNAPIIKWDYRKPDYGIEEAFEKLLEMFGHYEQNFKILLVDTPNITHFALPYQRNEYLFLLSAPFIRTLDLSKTEISLLLFEGFIRSKMGYFKEFVLTKPVKKALGTNFHGKKLDEGIFKEVLKKYDQIVFEKGFNFKQQFEVTKQMGMILKNNLKAWNIYVGLLKKIDDLVKNNILYRKYNKIYPSPELQLNWLRPKSRVL